MIRGMTWFRVQLFRAVKTIHEVTRNLAKKRLVVPRLMWRCSTRAILTAYAAHPSFENFRTVEKQSSDESFQSQRFNEIGRRGLEMKTLLTVVLFLLTASAVFGQDTGGGKGVAQMKDKMGLFTPAAIQWGAGPASLQKGARMMVLEGDPTQEGMFTMRLWLPDGFEVAPHWHSQVEHVTVISGVLQFGMGQKFDRTATREMPAGSFGYWPVGMKHFAWANGETVLQLHGRGPWTITYVNSADDPRKGTKS
jgi:hypothetical protein